MSPGWLSLSFSIDFSYVSLCFQSGYTCDLLKGPQVPQARALASPLRPFLHKDIKRSSIVAQALMPVDRGPISVFLSTGLQKPLPPHRKHTLLGLFRAVEP